jgi:hypothetical protein
MLDRSADDRRSSPIVPLETDQCPVSRMTVVIVRVRCPQPPVPRQREVTFSLPDASCRKADGVLRCRRTIAHTKEGALDEFVGWAPLPAFSIPLWYVGDQSSYWSRWTLG